MYTNNIYTIRYTRTHYVLSVHKQNVLWNPCKYGRSYRRRLVSLNYNVCTKRERESFIRENVTFSLPFASINSRGRIARQYLGLRTWLCTVILFCFFLDLSKEWFQRGHEVVGALYYVLRRVNIVIIRIVFYLFLLSFSFSFFLSLIYSFTLRGVLTCYLRIFEFA